MTKKQADIRPELVGELYTNGTDYFKLVSCESEPSATFENIAYPSPAENSMTKPISAFANLVLLKPVRPIGKLKKPRADIGGKHQPRKEPPIKQTPLLKPPAVIHIETESEEAIEEPTAESDKVKLIIRTPEPGAKDQQYHITIGDSETVGFGLQATIVAALVEFGGVIPDCLSDEDQKLLRGILGDEKGDALALDEAEAEAIEAEKPKSHRGRRAKLEVK